MHPCNVARSGDVGKGGRRYLSKMEKKGGGKKRERTSILKELAKDLRFHMG